MLDTTISELNNLRSMFWNRKVEPAPSSKERKSKGDTKRLGNRVTGVIATFGDIDTGFIYSVNDLISCGANIMIEVQLSGKVT